MGETEERKKMKLFVDDVRPAPKGWTLAKDYWQAISMLEDNWGELEELSLDHDISSFDPLDQKEYTGQDIVNWMERKCFGEEIPRFSVTIHSQNQAGAERMAQGLYGIGLRTIAKETLYPQSRDYIVPLSWFGKEYTTLLAYAAIAASEQADEDSEDY